MSHLFRSEQLRAHYSKEQLSDLGYKELLKLSNQTPKFVARSKAQIVSMYQSTNKKFVVHFITPSGTTPGVFYNQYVVLADLKKLIEKYQYKKTAVQIVRMAVNGNIKVSCNDPSGSPEPSWIYNFQYLATTRKYNQGKGENRFPEIRNPKLKGSLCKHLIQVLKTLPFLTNRIAADLVKAEVFVVPDQKKSAGAKKR